MTARWFIVNMDDGIVGVFATKRAAVLSRCTREHQVIKVHRYSSGSYEVRWHYEGDSHDGDSFFVEREDRIEPGGWGWAHETWKKAGSPMGDHLNLEDL